MRLSRVFLSLIFVCVIAACGPKSEAPASVQDSPYFLPQDKIIRVDGIDVRYRAEGPETGETLVMVHGFTSSLETWDALAADLSSDYRVIRLDLPGHGLTGPDPNARYTNDGTALFLQHFLEVLKIEDPVLIGNSLGGLVTWRLAAKSPDLVSKLVLISPGGYLINGVAEDPIAVPVMVKLYLTKAPVAGIKQATSALFADPSKLTNARLKQVRDMMVWNGNGEAFVQRAATFTLPEPTKELAKVTASTLIIWGDKDVMVPTAHGKRFVSAMPNAVLKVYETTGHVPQEEAPARLAADIRTFLKSQE